MRGHGYYASAGWSFWLHRQRSNIAVYNFCACVSVVVLFSLFRSNLRGFGCFMQGTVTGLIWKTTIFCITCSTIDDNWAGYRLDSWPAIKWGRPQTSILLLLVEGSVISLCWMVVDQIYWLVVILAVKAAFKLQLFPNVMRFLFLLTSNVISFLGNCEILDFWPTLCYSLLFVSELPVTLVST